MKDDGAWDVGGDGDPRKVGRPRWFPFERTCPRPAPETQGACCARIATALHMLDEPGAVEYSAGSHGDRRNTRSIGGGHNYSSCWRWRAISTPERPYTCQLQYAVVCTESLFAQEVPQGPHVVFPQHNARSCARSVHMCPWCLTNLRIHVEMHICECYLSVALAGCARSASLRTIPDRGSQPEGPRPSRGRPRSSARARSRKTSARAQRQRDA